MCVATRNLTIPHTLLKSDVNSRNESAEFIVDLTIDR